MKKTLTKALSLILTACFIMSLCVCTTAMAADETIVEKTLKYFDDETWNSTGQIVTGANTATYEIPKGVSSLTVNNVDKAKVERVTGVFGKQSEDISLKLAANGYKQGRNLFADVFSCADASTYPVNTSNGDRFTVYMDLATDAILSGYTSSANGFIGVRTRGAKTTAGTNQTTDIIWFVNDGDGTYSIYAHGSKAITDYVPGTWVNVAVEVNFGNGNASCNTYINGTLLGATSINSMTGLSYIIAGYQQATDANSQTPNLYIDNVAFYKEGFSADRYNAIETASALSVSDIIGNNADLNNIESNLNLITEKSSSTITWESSNDAVVSTTGVVTPSATEDTTVTLTATVASNGASETKAYTVTVPKNELITFDEIKDKNLYEGSIVSNLVLPEKLSNGTEIIWESSNENVIAKDGKVTRYNDASNSVTLTAKKKSDNSTVKEFDLYVIGDDIVNDDMKDSGKMKSSSNLAYINNTTYHLEGMQIADSTANGTAIEAIYNAAPGAVVTADVARYGGARAISFWASPDGDTYTQFGSGKTIDGENLEFAQAGGWKKDVWTSSVPVPDGTRYIKVYTANLSSAMVTNIHITSNTPEDITFTDIANGNAAPDKIMSDLDLNGLTDVVSSNTDIIAADGSVTRPEKDTVVTLTAKINNDSITATKIFTLTVLGTKEEVKSEKPWILYNSADKLSLISNSTLAKDCKIEFDADVFYAGNAAKTATGVIAVYDSTGKLLEIKTVDKTLSASAEKQRVSTELTLTKDSYTGAIVRGFIWEKGTLKPIGEKNGYTAK